MTDQNTQQEMTIDDVWVNRLAQRLGVVIAQNERLQIENEALQQQVQQLQGQIEMMRDVPPLDMSQLSNGMPSQPPDPVLT